jgi:hypothetical protein
LGRHGDADELPDCVVPEPGSRREIAGRTFI